MLGKNTTELKCPLHHIISKGVYPHDISLSNLVVRNLQGDIYKASPLWSYFFPSFSVLFNVNESLNPAPLKGKGLKSN